MRRADPRALETRRSRRAQSTRKLPWIGRDDPHRTPGKEKQASSVPAFGGPTRPKKPVRRCFKLRPPWRAGFAGFASGCRLLSGSGVATWMPAVGIHPCDHRSFKTPGGCPAVDRMPTNRHAATGTCEIGRGGYTQRNGVKQVASHTFSRRFLTASRDCGRPASVGVSPLGSRVGGRIPQRKTCRSARRSGRVEAAEGVRGLRPNIGAAARSTGMASQRSVAALSKDARTVH
jgi:hypothetical protein